MAATVIRMKQLAADAHAAETLEKHIEDRAAWDSDSYPIALLEAWSRGERTSEAQEDLVLGEYLEGLLARAGWWVTAADIALPDPNVLSQLRTLLAEVLALVPAAWSQTLIHAPRGPLSACTPLLLVARYCAFRRVIVEAIAGACPGVDLSALRDLA